MTGDVIHLQLRDTTIACGASHVKYPPGNQNTQCCRLSIGRVTCEKCLKAARLSRLVEDEVKS